MTARIRADLESVPGYVPGRTIPGAVKLASNEVSAGPLPSVLAAIADAAAGVNRYPDNGVTALLDRLAARLEVPTSQLTAGCGAVMLCQQLMQATCGPADEVLFAWRSFEAYREFVTDPDVPDGVALGRDRDNLAVLRTFSKAYGLAGLRVGYCVAPEPVTAALGKVYVPFSVNSLAQTAALASLQVADELLARCRGVAAERDRVHAELLAMGYPVPESQANFVWLPLGEQTTAFTEHCLEHKVVIRAFPGDGARVTVGDHGENEAFLAAARGFPLTHPAER